MTETLAEEPKPADTCPEVEIGREVEKERHAKSMDDAQLCGFIREALAPARNALKDNLAYIAEARKRFAQPGRRVPVPGRPAWGEWIRQNLGMSDRHVRRLLAEQRDRKKPKTKKTEPTVKGKSAAIAIGKGDADTLATVWCEAFGSLDQAQRRIAIARFLALIPEEHLKDIAMATGRGGLLGAD